MPRALSPVPIVVWLISACLWSIAFCSVAQNAGDECDGGSTVSLLQQSKRTKKVASPKHLELANELANDSAQRSVLAKQIEPPKDGNLEFIHIPKNAGSSVKDAGKAEGDHRFREDEIHSDFGPDVLLYMFSVIVLVVLLTAIYGNRGPLVCGAIIAYVMSLSLMSVLIRNVYVNHHFNFPTFLTASHAVATFTLGMSVMLYERIQRGKPIKLPSRSMIWGGLVPVGVAFSTSIGLANVGLMHTNAHFYEMFGSPIALITFALGLLLGEPFKWQLIAPMCILTVGLVIISFGEVSFNMFGTVCIGIAVLARAAKAQLQNRLLKGSHVTEELEPVALAVWVSVVCFIILAVWSAATEGAAPLRQIWDFGTCLAILATMITASVLNIVALFVLRDLGPVAQQIVGNFKGVLSCLAAVAAFGEQISSQQILGYGIMIMGSAWYNVVDRRMKAEEPLKTDKINEATPIISQATGKV